MYPSNAKEYLRASSYSLFSWNYYQNTIKILLCLWCKDLTVNHPLLLSTYYQDSNENPFPILSSFPIVIVFELKLIYLFVPLKSIPFWFESAKCSQWVILSRLLVERVACHCTHFRRSTDGLGNRFCPPQCWNYSSYFFNGFYKS